MIDRNVFPLLDAVSPCKVYIIVTCYDAGGNLSDNLCYNVGGCLIGLK